MGTLFTQTAWTIQRTGTVPANSVAYFSFTQQVAGQPRPAGRFVRVACLMSAATRSRRVGRRRGGWRAWRRPRCAAASTPETLRPAPGWPGGRADPLGRPLRVR
jgi:hypothetical protein